ncbi:MAG: hypothetical protein DRP51_01485 [Candidatus Zixiibacteriota bacterium]|nr:MAG: hypothetical protein DRP51_01485 [candidate division Zixibacteria bacterium]
MIEELNSSEFKKVNDIFTDNNPHLPVFSIISGNHPGRIFVDNRNGPQAAIAWAIGRWAYIDGRTDNTGFNLSIPEFINKIVIPDSKKMEMDWFELYLCGNPMWKRIIDRSVKRFDSGKHFESVYIWDRKKYSRFRSDYRFPADVSVKISDVPLLSEKAQASSFVSEKFRDKTTFGFRVLSKKEELTLCCSTGFEVGRKFMVDIITHDPNHRGKGYATMAAVALLNFSLENNLEPLWETAEDNIGSQRLAEKLGFVKNQTYPVFTVEF